MADQANERLKALRASMKVALGKLTGSDELEAQGRRERSGKGAGGRAADATARAKATSAAKAKATSPSKAVPAPSGKHPVAGVAKPRSSRRPS